MTVEASRPRGEGTFAKNKLSVTGTKIASA